MQWETAVLNGGPADGLRIRITDRPSVLQVMRPCPVEAFEDGEDDEGVQGEPLQVQALYIYRRAAGQPLRYRFDPASP